MLVFLWFPIFIRILKNFQKCNNLIKNSVEFKTAPFSRSYFLKTKKKNRHEKWKSGQQSQNRPASNLREAVAIFCYLLSIFTVDIIKIKIYTSLKNRKFWANILNFDYERLHNLENTILGHKNSLKWKKNISAWIFTVLTYDEKIFE